MTESIDIILENVSTMPQAGWTTIGLPEPLPDSCRYLVASGTMALADGQDLIVYADEMDPGERRVVTLKAVPDPMPPFQFHPHALDKPQDLNIAFEVEDDGVFLMSEHMPFKTAPVGESFLCIDSQNEARLRLHFRTRVEGANLNIEGWVTFYSGQAWAEYEIRTSYGTTAPGEPREVVLGSLRMLTGEPMHVDWGVRKGLRPCFWNKEANLYETEIATEGQWFRCRTVEVFGAMLLERDGADWQDFFTMPPHARTHGPIVGMVEQKHWHGHWSPTEAIPGTSLGYRYTDTEQRRRYSSMRARLRTPSNEYEQRPYAQPPNSGQTGEQPDFGCSRGEAVIAMEEPWAIYDLRYSVQAWLLRPYANREPNGAPVQAKDHPEAALYNLRPDERFGSDMLGWPKPVGWISGYTTSDSQHRSDNLLWAMWRLTRSPSLERTIRDIIELEKMALKQPSPPRGSGVGAPRGWGRPLLSWAHGLQCGFEEFEPLIVSMVSRMAWAADYTARPYPTAQQVLSSREGKYGWNNADGTPIRGVTWWQEAIAVIGLYAAWRVTGMPSAREMALVVAKSICRHAFFEREPGTFDHCYVTRWLDGAALTREQYLDPLFAVREGAASYWTAAALRVLLALEPECADAPRARAILAGYVPNNWDKACWAAIA